MTKRAVVLLSGGLDSTTAAAIIRHEGGELFALTVDYNQRHRIEIQAAQRVANWLGVKKHVIMPIDASVFGDNSLTSSLEMRKSVPREKIGQSIPNTYVPARNTVMLSLALAFAESTDASRIIIGASQVDFSGYPDCQLDYLDAFNQLAILATKRGRDWLASQQTSQQKNAVEHSRDNANVMPPIAVEAPLLDKSKTETILLGLELGVDYSLTHSCYDPMPNGFSCGKCESCLLRLAAFQAAGLSDPLRYA